MERTGLEPVTPALSKQCSKPTELTFLVKKRRIYSSRNNFRYLYNVKKYQVTIQFEWNDQFASLIPPHRTYINHLINKDVIDQYVVSMESQRVWITLNAKNKTEVKQLLKKSPLFKYWTNFEVDELYVMDGQLYRLPAVQPN